MYSPAEALWRVREEEPRHPVCNREPIPVCRLVVVDPFRRATIWVQRVKHLVMKLFKQQSDLNQARACVCPIIRNWGSYRNSPITTQLFELTAVVSTPDTSSLKIKTVIPFNYVNI